MKERYSNILRTSITGIIANIFLVIFKAIIGLLSNSIAITLDAVNNLTDAISSIITILGVYLAGKDPNKKHPFGYGRIEYLSTLAIGVIIIYAGITACIQSIKGIIYPEKPTYSGIMLLVIAVAVVVKIILGLYFRKKGSETASDALTASGTDALFDALISVVTIITAVVYMFLGISLEAYLGIVISAIIIKAGVEILKETISKILGEGAGAELVKNVKKTIASHEGVNGAYDLVFNNYGQDIYLASVHIEVDDYLTANQIDMLTRHIVDDIKEEYGVLLTAIGIYSHNTSDKLIAEMREKTRQIATSHEFVKQIHGFYADNEKKKIRFDMVISFDAPSRASLYEHVMEDLSKEFPDYEISAGMDADFNEI